MKVISQSQLREETEARQPKATHSIFRRMIQTVFGDGTGAMDLAAPGIQLDHDALCDLYESARRLQPECTNIQMPLETVADILSPSTSKFAGRILRRMLERSLSAVLSMTPDQSQPSGHIRPVDGTDPVLTFWFS